MDINEQVSRITGLWVRKRKCDTCGVKSRLFHLGMGWCCGCINRGLANPPYPGRPLDFLNDDAAFGKLVKWCAAAPGYKNIIDMAYAMFASDNPAEALCMAVVEAHKER